jgi:hypothetical protein
VGTEVDSSRIPLFKQLNRGVVKAVHSDGLVMVLWDREGPCLQHPSELQRIPDPWGHFRE